VVEILPRQYLLPFVCIELLYLSRKKYKTVLEISKVPAHPINAIVISAGLLCHDVFP
jgi:hypothetical protein